MHATHSPAPLDTPAPCTGPAIARQSTVGIYIAAAIGFCFANGSAASPLDGKSYIIELSLSQYGSGYGNYLVPPLAKTMARSGLRAANGPGADVVVNIQTSSDVGKWIGTGASRIWMYEIAVTVGISPESYQIPFEGTPAFGVKAKLMTPNPDRDDELACLIGLAARTALANYRPTGHLATDGTSCLRN